MVGCCLTELGEVIGSSFSSVGVSHQIREAIGFERCRDLKRTIGLKVSSGGDSSEFWFEVEKCLGIDLLILCGSDLEDEAAFDGAIGFAVLKRIAFPD
jgi:hypothetical protein